MPRPITAYWAPVAGSRAKAAPHVSPSSCRPTSAGSAYSTAPHPAPSTASTPPISSVSRTTPCLPEARPTTGGPNAFAELNSTFSGPKSVVAPRSAPTASGVANSPRPSTANWLEPLPTANSTTNRCPRCPRRRYGRRSAAAPRTYGRSWNSPSASAGSAETPHTSTSRPAEAPSGCSSSAATTHASRSASAASARSGVRSAEKQYRSPSWTSTSGSTRPSARKARPPAPGRARPTTASAAPPAAEAAAVNARPERHTAPSRSSAFSSTTVWPTYAMFSPRSTLKVTYTIEKSAKPDAEDSRAASTSTRMLVALDAAWSRTEETAARPRRLICGPCAPCAGPPCPYRRPGCAAPARPARSPGGPAPGSAAA